VRTEYGETKYSEDGIWRGRGMVMTEYGEDEIWEGRSIVGTTYRED
jgi:hypothetical protein